ncbi:MAG: hypothetical protein D6675_09795 [Gemmatimonadetes bacterium]|nr:MAG: hypothetical protein D6675_09795 [Gemmatimonadota bacterium]
MIQASVYLTLQQPLKILQACDLAAKQTPQSSQMAYQLHNQRVMAYGMLIDLSRGEAELAALSRLESTPEFAATTTYARAYLYTQCEQYDRAISYGEQAAALLTPVDLRFVALITLAYAYTHTGQFDLAQSCLDRADALEFPMSRPNYALLVLLGRLRLAWQQNQPLPEGSAQLEALKPHLADHQLCYVALGQAFIALQEGRYPAAVSHLNNALHRIPAEHRQLRVDVFYMLGLAHYHLHHINEWSKACEEIKAMAPQSLKLQSLLQLRSDTL